MRTLYLILTVVICVAQAGWAYDIRIWEDVDGNQFEGRFYREIFDKLTIEDEEGNQKTFEVEDLSELDKKYLRTIVPPELEAKVSRKTRQLPGRENPRRQVTNFRYKIFIEVKKKSQRPFTSRLKAEIFMIAEENTESEYCLINKTTAEFILPLKKKNTVIEMESPWVPMRIWEGVGAWPRGARLGMDYAGHLLVISNMQGDICLTDSNLDSSFNRWIRDPETIQNLRDLWTRYPGRGAWLSRLFDKTGSKVPVPRPPPM